MTDLNFKHLNHYYFINIIRMIFIFYYLYENYIQMKNDEFRKIYNILLYSYFVFITIIVYNLFISITFEI